MIKLILSECVGVVNHSGDNSFVIQNNFAIRYNFGGICLYYTTFARKIAFCAEGVTMVQGVEVEKRKGNIKNTSVIPRPVTPVTGRGNPFLF